MKEQDAAHSFEKSDLTKYCETLEAELTRLRSELQQERELRKELVESLTNVIKVCKSPTLTTHGLNHVEKAESLIKKSKKIIDYGEDREA